MKGVKTFKQLVIEWQNDVIDKIVSDQKGKYNLCLPKRHGKTTMLLKLANFFGKVHVITPCEKILKPFKEFLSEESDILLIEEAEYVNIKKVNLLKYKLIIQTSGVLVPGFINFKLDKLWIDMIYAIQFHPKLLA